MGKTIVEKILSAKSGTDVKAGDTALIEIDVRSARDFGGASVVQNIESVYPGEKVADEAKTFFTFDCNAPANTIGYATNQHKCREFARAQDIKVYDVDAGIGSHVVIEEGIALPGKTVVGTDSHLNILGAIGALGQGMGDTDIAFTFRTGKTWFEVPETIRLKVTGKIVHPASAKDLTLAVMKFFGASGALGKVVELYGDLIDSLDLPQRITLSSMGTEAGAIAFIIPPDKKILDWCKAKTSEVVTPFYADEDAVYSEDLSLDVGELEPLIAKPGSPNDVVPVREVAGRPLDAAFIGSCTNGRFEDFELVAEIIGDRKVNPRVMAKIVPATKAVFGQLLDSGLMTKFHKAGFIVSNQGCGGCAQGQIGMTGKNEVQLSTSNRNFRGKQGHGDTYLTSPATAAASSIMGVITDPREVMGK
ncbi:3-isopropylmalate dehydratase large subunit [bacterium]|nr:3-isopropylmalate dehydratase large subunit [bacterium]